MNWVRAQMDRGLALVGAIFSAILAFLLILVGGKILYILTSLLALSACAFWIVKRKKAIEWPERLSSRRAFLLLSSAFFVLFAMSNLSLILRQDTYARPASYFVLIALAALVVTMEIMSSPLHGGYIGLVLTQIAILGLSLQWSEQLLFPSVLGVDPVWHRMFTLRLLDLGRIPQGYAYSSFPLFHLATASHMLTADLDFKAATMFSIGLPQIVMDVLFSYLVMRFLLHDKRLALLAGLTVTIANYHVQSGWWTSPHGFAALFILPVVYVTLKTIQDNRVAGTLALIVFTMAIVLGHPIVAVAICIVLFVFWLTPRVTASKRPRSGRERIVTGGIPALVTTFTIAWWVYAFAGPFSTLPSVLQSGFAIDTLFQGPVYQGYAASVPLFEQAYNVLGFVVFFAFSILGCLYLVSKRKAAFTSFAVAGLSLLGLGFVSLVAGRELLNVRWWYFSQIVLAGPTAIGVFVVAAGVPQRKLKPAFVAAVVFAVSFLMITSSVANTDSYAFTPDLAARSAFTTSELEAAAFLTQHWKGKIASDFAYSTNPSNSVFAGYYNVSLSRIVPLDQDLISGNFNQTNTLIVIRKSIIDHPFGLAGGLFRLSYDPTSRLTQQGFDKVYDSGSVDAYLKPAQP